MKDILITKKSPDYLGGFFLVAFLQKSNYAFGKSLTLKAILCS